MSPKNVNTGDVGPPKQLRPAGPPGSRPRSSGGAGTGGADEVEGTGGNERRKVRPIVNGAAVTRRTSLLLPSRMDLPEWAQVGRQIHAIHESSAWWLGDWLVYGQQQYPDRYRRAVEETSLDYQTLRNYAWVARRFVPGRRRQALSFQHHAEVAGLPEPDQERWLDQAEQQSLSRNALRRRVRLARAAGIGDAQPAKAIDIEVDVPAPSRQQWQDAASAAGADLLTWMVDNLDRAATVALEPVVSDGSAAGIELPRPRAEAPGRSAGALPATRSAPA